jgi:hypothetical protein
MAHRKVRVWGMARIPALIRQKNGRGNVIQPNSSRTMNLEIWRYYVKIPRCNERQHL